MLVFKCVLSGIEFFSDAKPLHEDEEGMIYVNSAETVDSGVAVDTGAGNAFGGGDEEEVDDGEERKLDHFWQFGDIENEVCFKSFRKFKKDYFVHYVNMIKRLVKEGKIMEENMDTIKDNLKSGLTWIEENFDSLQFFSIPVYIDDYDEYPDEDGEASVFCANMAYLLHDEKGARFYFIKGAFLEEKF